MTGYTGIHVHQDATDTGTTAQGGRLATGGQLAHDGSSPLDVRLGVLMDDGSPVVSGAGDMSYNVRAAVFVCAYSDANGPTLSANDAAVNVATTAAPGSNSRIDTVWVRQNLLTADGGSGTAIGLEFGVVQGTAGASPTAPAAPSGALALAFVTVTTGATATSGLTFTRAHAWTVANGGIIPMTSTERAAVTPFEGLTIYNLTASRVQVYRGGNWHPVGGNASAAGDDTSPTIVAANTTYTKAITFPAGRFAVAPKVTVTASEVNPSTSTTEWFVTDVTTSGANVGVQRSNPSASLDFMWTAIEPG